MWRDKKGLAWVNPYHRELWNYNIGVAEELAKMGFGEIQFDYIRFPEPYPRCRSRSFPAARAWQARHARRRSSRKPTRASTSSACARRPTSSAS